MNTSNNIIKPKAYSHLSDYQYALQQVLNSLCVFISVDGTKVNAQNYMPLSISQLMRINKLYTQENTLSKGNTDYIINLDSGAIDKITEDNVTLADLLFNK